MVTVVDLYYSGRLKQDMKAVWTHKVLWWRTSCWRVHQAKGGVEEERGEGRRTPPGRDDRSGSSLSLIAHYPCVAPCAPHCARPATPNSRVRARGVQPFGKINRVFIVTGVIL